MRVFITAHPVLRLPTSRPGPMVRGRVGRRARAARARRPARYVGVASIKLQLPWLAAATALGRWPGGGPPSASGGCGGAGPLPPVPSCHAAGPGRCGLRAGAAARDGPYSYRQGSRPRTCSRLSRDSNGKEELATIPRYQRLNASGFAERKDMLAEGPTEPLTRVPYTCWVCGGEGNRVRAFICTLARAAPSPTPFSLACEW